MPPISIIGFGLASVSSANRVPRPPASRTAFMRHHPGPNEIGCCIDRATAHPPTGARTRSRAGPKSLQSRCARIIAAAGLSRAFCDRLSAFTLRETGRLCRANVLRLPAKSCAYQTRARPARSRAHPSIFAWSLRVDSVDCLVIGAGVVGLAVARTLACAGREVVVVEAEERHRNGDEFAQQRGYPRRDLLPDGTCQDAALRRRKGAAVRFLPRLRRPPPALRQADRGGRRDRGAQARRARGASSRQRRRRPRVADRRRGACARACAEAERALLSPSTGIVDSHALMLALGATPRPTARWSHSGPRSCPAERNAAT